MFQNIQRKSMQKVLTRNEGKTFLKMDKLLIDDFFLFILVSIDKPMSLIQPPPSGFDDSKTLPKCLKDALNALEKDDVMKKSLGEDFVECFLTLKRDRDLTWATHEEQVGAYWTLI